MDSVDEHVTVEEFIHVVKCHVPRSRLHEPTRMMRELRTMIDIQPNGILEDDVPLTPVYGTPIDHPGAPDQRLRYLRALQNTVGASSCPALA